MYNLTYMLIVIMYYPLPLPLLHTHKQAHTQTNKQIRPQLNLYKHTRKLPNTQYMHIHSPDPTTVPQATKSSGASSPCATASRWHVGQGGSHVICLWLLVLPSWWRVRQRASMSPSHCLCLCVPPCCISINLHIIPLRVVWISSWDPYSDFLRCVFIV